MISLEKFRVEWNGYEKTVFDAFKGIRQSSDLFDVTLACDDGKIVKAHKFLLSVFSPMFKKILKGAEFTFGLSG